MQTILTGDEAVLRRVVGADTLLRGRDYAQRVGLNLTEADYCILLDPWWNPATEAQAVDRVHRIGQTKKVMVYRLVAKDTIEGKVMALKDRKAALFGSVMDGGAFSSGKLSAADVRDMLE